AGRRLRLEEVAFPRLIVDAPDGAGRARAEGVLHGGVRGASGAEGGDVLGHAVGALHLVERSAESAEECANGAVGRDAGGVARRVDVARPLARRAPGRATGARAPTGARGPSVSASAGARRARAAATAPARARAAATAPARAAGSRRAT